MVMPSLEELRHRFEYDEATGLLTWRNPPKSHSRLRGRVAGHVRKKDGYWAVRIKGVRYALHRIIYKYMTGLEPDIMDHINRDSSDNRWVNLRSVTPSENTLNSAYRENGAARSTASGRWEARSFNKHLGTFDTEEEARAVSLAARAESLKTGVNN